MIRIFVLLFCCVFAGCASLPDNYSLLTAEDFLKGITNNNKPVIIPAKYSARTGSGFSMFGSNYNVIGSYGSNVVLDAIDESSKYCADNNMEILGVENIGSRKVLICEKFIAFHLVSRERAGSDTGHTYAYFDHIALFDLTSELNESMLKKIVETYISFEEETVDHENVLGYENPDQIKIISALSKYEST